MERNSYGLVAAMLSAAALALAAVPGSLRAQAGAPRTAQALVEDRCSLCHGLDGGSVSSLYPRLAGQHPEYLVKQLGDFKVGRRKGTMNEMAADLREEEMAALASYFAQKDVPVRMSGEADLAPVGQYIYKKGNSYAGVPACQECHGAKGMGTARLPRLSGQRSTYLVRQLKQFNRRESTNDNAIMHSIASKLTELEMNAVAVYASGLN